MLLLLSRSAPSHHHNLEIRAAHRFKYRVIFGDLIRPRDAPAHCTVSHGPVIEPAVTIDQHISQLYKPVHRHFQDRSQAKKYL